MTVYKTITRQNPDTMKFDSSDSTSTNEIEPPAMINLEKESSLSEFVKSQEKDLKNIKPVHKDTTLG